MAFILLAAESVLIESVAAGAVAAESEGAAIVELSVEVAVESVAVVLSELLLQAVKKPAITRSPKNFFIVVGFGLFNGGKGRV